MPTQPGFECWEFFGRGDPEFGGNADDRILYRIDAAAFIGWRSLEFLRGWEVFRYGKHSMRRAIFATKEEAEAAGRPLARPGARVAGVPATPDWWGQWPSQDDFDSAFVRADGGQP